MSTRGVVIGLDGAAWHLLEPMLDAGIMPKLSALRDRGAAGILTSTVPTYTPPAWTSATTGVNPGRHGIYGFHAGHAQNERQELMHSGKIKAPTVWEIANDQGARAGIYNLPLTYPPQALDGWMVSGMMTPGYGHHLKGFVFPHDLEEQVLAWAPGYVVELKTSWEDDWRDESLCRRALDSLAQRKIVLERLLEQDPVDVVFAVIETPDRLQHAYYRYMDPADEFYGSDAATLIRPFLHDCFAAMDEIVGLLCDYAGGDGIVIACSDHGFTAWEMSVHTNSLLQRWGLLRLRRGTRVMQSRPVKALVPLAKRILPAKTARRAKGRTFAAIDWTHTKAFASPIPQQGIFVNLVGRERFGTVAPDEADDVKNDIAQRFASLVGPDRRPVTDRIWRAEDVFTGDARDGAPDLLPVLRDHRWELDDEIFHRDPFTDASHLPRGVHHPDGMVVVAGPGVHRGAAIRGSVLDVTPTLLYGAGMKVPEGLDGTVLTDAFEADHVTRHGVEKTTVTTAARRDETSPYTAEEEAAIEESLRGLGYL